MQRSQLKMVIIVDEFGGTSGLITIQDVIEEILGNDSKDITEKKEILKIIDENNFLIEAQLNLEELNNVLGLNLPLIDEYQTLGGFLSYQWQKIPIQGETLKYDNLLFTVIKSEGPCLKQIHIQRQPSVNYDLLVKDMTSSENYDDLDTQNNYDGE